MADIWTIVVSVLGVFAAAGISMSLAKKKGLFGTPKVMVVGLVGASLIMYAIVAVPQLAILAGLGLPAIWLVGSYFKVFRW